MGGGGHKGEEVLSSPSLIEDGLEAGVRGHGGGCGCRGGTGGRMVAACTGGSGGRDATGFCGIEEQRSHGTSPTPLLPLVLNVADLSGGVVRQTQTACEGLAETQLSHISAAVILRTQPLGL